MSMQSKHVQDAITYAMATVDKKRVAGRLEILACQRFLNDLERSARNDPDFPYFFDEAAGSKTCRFIEGMKHVKGPLAGKNIVLEPWQSFCIVNIFGWLHVETKLRRFRSAYQEVARKNGKSSMLAPIGLYMLCADNEEGSEVYTAATTRDQAKLVFEIAVMMCRRDPEFRRYFGVDIGQSAILPLAVTQRLTGSKMAALSAQGNTLDGLNPHCSLIDELHAHNSPAVYNVLDTAMGARAHPLLYSITTAGSDQGGICYQIRDYVVNLLEGHAVDETFFGLVFTLDKDDIWSDEEVWAKANPNLGVSVQLDDIQRQARKAKEIPSERPDFMTKRLNIWTSASTMWIPPEKFADCRTPGMNMLDFRDWDCFIGLDLAERNDLSARSAVFVKDEKFAVFVRYFLPEARAVKGLDKNSDLFFSWGQDGKLTLTPGNVTDMRYIKEDLIEMNDNYNVVECGFDPWAATQLAISLIEEGVNMVEVRQNTSQMSEPAKFFHEIVYDKKLMHDCDVLQWNLGNCVVTPDVNRNILVKKPVKQEHKKIDGIIATIIALNRYISNKNEAFPYESRGLRVLNF